MSGAAGTRTFYEKLGRFLLSFCLQLLQKIYDIFRFFMPAVLKILDLAHYAYNDPSNPIFNQNEFLGAFQEPLATSGPYRNAASVF
jgi:hypothetical protein